MLLTRCPTKIGLMLVHRRRRWTNIKTILAQRFVCSSHWSAVWWLSHPIPWWFTLWHVCNGAAALSLGARPPPGIWTSHRRQSLSRWSKLISPFIELSIYLFIICPVIISRSAIWSENHSDLPTQNFTSDMYMTNYHWKTCVSYAYL